MKPLLRLKQSTASNYFDMSANIKIRIKSTHLIDNLIHLYSLCIYVFLIYTKLVRLSSCQGCPTPNFFPSTIRPPLILVLQLLLLFLCNHFGLLKCISSQLCSVSSMGIGSSVVGPHSCQRAVHTIRSSTSVKGVQHNRETFLKECSFN